jgi:hypothetical protein
MSWELTSQLLESGQLLLIKTCSKSKKKRLTMEVETISAEESALIEMTGNFHLLAFFSLFDSSSCKQRPFTGKEGPPFVNSFQIRQQRPRLGVGCFVLEYDSIHPSIPKLNPLTRLNCRM